MANWQASLKQERQGNELNCQRAQFSTVESFRVFSLHVLASGFSAASVEQRVKEKCFAAGR